MTALSKVVNQDDVISALRETGAALDMRMRPYTASLRTSLFSPFQTIAHRPRQVVFYSARSPLLAVCLPLHNLSLHRKGGGAALPFPDILHQNAKSIQYGLHHRDKQHDLQEGMPGSKLLGRSYISFGQGGVRAGRLDVERDCSV